MKNACSISAVVIALLAAACTTDPAPNDSASRALNEMKAVPRPIPPKPDPRDLKIAELQQQIAELTRVRSSLTRDLDQAKSRTGELESQLSQRDRELSSLRSASERQLSAKDQELAALKGTAGEKDRLGGQLAALQGQLSSKDQELASLRSNTGDREKLVADLASSKQRTSDLESELARRDREMAGLKGALDQQKSSLAAAADDLSRLLQAEVAKGHVTMKQLGDQFTLGLATTLLFDSGEATLKPGGADVLQRIGGVLKQYPDRSIQVAGHTDSVPVKGRLAKTFPTNVELSQARADSARQALIDGGMAADRIEAKGHADSRPIASNSTAEGRQKNRRVEVVVGH